MYSPALLPVPGFDDLTLNVLRFHSRWVETLRIIDGMLADNPFLPIALKMSLDNLRFHTGTVLAAINQFLRTGGAMVDDAYEIPSVHESIAMFQQELLRTQAHWDSASAGETASFGAVQLDTKSEQALIDATKPQTITESLIFLAGGALVIGVLMLVRR